MHHQGVVAGVADGIGLVVSHPQAPFTLESAEYPAGQTGITAMEHPDVPGTHLVAKHRREAVEGDQDAGPGLALPRLGRLEPQGLARRLGGTPDSADA